MQVQPQSLQNKGVLVTGAGSGLGEATARAFGYAGCQVACVDISQAAVERISQELEKQDVHSAGFVCDVSNSQAVFSTVQKVVERFGRLDIMVNCAAIDHTVSVEEMTVEQWDQVIGINLRGPFLFAKAVWPHMKQQRGGHIFNVASTAALRSWANASAYHASKRALVGFSQALGVEGRSCGIRVTTILPGGMKTHFFDRFADQGIPMPDPGKLQDPVNVANTIVFAAQLPAESAIQEVLITPFDETSWP